MKVAHSPTPSSVKIKASSNGDGKMHLMHDLHDVQKNLFCLLRQNLYHVQVFKNKFFLKEFFS